MPDKYDPDEKFKPDEDIEPEEALRRLVNAPKVEPEDSDQMLPDEAWERATDPNGKPGVIKIDGQAYPLVEFEDED